MRQFRERLRTIAFQNIDAQIDRRARRQRGALFRRPRAKSLRELIRQPFGIIAAHMIGRGVERRRFQPRAFFIRKRRRRMSLAGAQSGDGGGVKPARFAQGAKHDRARRIGAHHVSRRRRFAKRVEQQAGDGGAILRAGETMPLAPILQRIGGGPTTLGERAENLDGGGNMGGGSHRGWAFWGGGGQRR